jgi:pyrroline-5-carboxylate reductase
MPREDARRFAQQALLGSVRLLADVGESPAALKDRVASPAGTTIAGLATLEDRGVRGALIRMVRQVATAEVEGGER